MDSPGASLCLQGFLHRSETRFSGFPELRSFSFGQLGRCFFAFFVLCLLYRLLEMPLPCVHPTWPEWGLCEYVILRLQIETRWVARVLAGTFLSHMAGRSLPFQCFHSPVRFLFVSFPSHGKSADLCSKLSLTPTLTLHTWISFHFFGGR